MTEKEYCIFCTHFQTEKWNNQKGVFDHYCDISNEKRDMIDFGCSNFEREKRENENGINICEVMWYWNNIFICILSLFVVGLLIMGLLL